MPQITDHKPQTTNQKSQITPRTRARPPTTEQGTTESAKLRFPKTAELRDGWPCNRGTKQNLKASHKKQSVQSRPGRVRTNKSSGRTAHALHNALHALPTLPILPTLRCTQMTQHGTYGEHGMPTGGKNRITHRAERRQARRQETGGRKKGNRGHVNPSLATQRPNDPHTIPYLTLTYLTYNIPDALHTIHTNPYQSVFGLTSLSTTTTNYSCHSPFTLRHSPFILHHYSRPFLSAFPPCLEQCVNAHASVPMFCAPSLNGANACLHSRRRQMEFSGGPAVGSADLMAASSRYATVLDREICTTIGTGFVVFTWVPQPLLFQLHIRV